MSDSWIPINDHPGDQRYDAIAGTEEVSYWGEIGPDRDEVWSWTIVGANDSAEQWDAAAGTAATELEAKRAVETWRPTQSVR